MRPENEASDLNHAIQFINTNQYEEFSALTLHGNAMYYVLAVIVHKLLMLCRGQLATNEKPITIYRQMYAVEKLYCRV